MERIFPSFLADSPLAAPRPPPSKRCFLTDFHKFLKDCFIICYPVSVWTRPESFFEHTRKCFCKNHSWSCYSRRVSHMTPIIHGSQHSQHSKKHKKQPETRKQVVYITRIWQKIQCSRAKTERNRVNTLKRKLRKRKETKCSKKKLIDAPCESNINTC